MSNDAIIDTLLSRVRTLGDEREHAREDLGATDCEGLRDAARRVVRERDDARAREALAKAARDAAIDERQRAEQERDEARAEVERLRSLIGSSTRDDEAHELRRVLTGTVNDIIVQQKTKTATMLAEHGRSSMQHRNAVKRLDELRDAHNKLQSLQVDYSHARMLLGGLLRAHLADDLADKVFHFGLAQEYFAVREGEG
jgi:hypothetical protein